MAGLGVGAERGAIALPSPVSLCSRVTKWARELGDELWELGRQISKPDEIKRVSAQGRSKLLGVYSLEKW